jgi:hypothetical protein
MSQYKNVNSATINQNEPINRLALFHTRDYFGSGHTQKHTECFAHSLVWRKQFSAGLAICFIHPKQHKKL